MTRRTYQRCIPWLSIPIVGIGTTLLHDMIFPGPSLMSFLFMIVVAWCGGVGGCSLSYVIERRIYGADE